MPQNDGVSLVTLVPRSCPACQVHEGEVKPLVTVAAIHKSIPLLVPRLVSLDVKEHLQR